MSSSKIFKPIDEAFIKQIDAFKNSPLSQKISDEMRLLSENGQKIVNYSLTVISIIIPFIIVAIIFAINVSQKSEIEIKESIIESISNYRKASIEFNKSGQGLISPFPISSQEDLKKRIENTLKLKSINSERVTILKFESEDASDMVVKNTAELRIKDFSLSNLNDFFVSILANEKMKVSSLNLSRNGKTETIEGTLDIVQYSKKRN